MFTFKDWLRFSVRPRSKSASGTLLGRVSRVNVINLYAFYLSLIFQELFKLPETPAMYLSALLSPCLDVVSDVFQILKDKNRIVRHHLDNLFRNAMVHVCHITVLFKRDSLQVSFGRLRSALLQFRSNSVIPILNLQMIRVKKLIVGAHRYLVDSPIDAKDVGISGDAGFRNISFKHNVKENFRFLHKQLGRFSFPTNVLFKIFRQVKFDFLAAINCEKGQLVSIKPYIKRVRIISDGALFAARISAITFQAPLDTFCCLVSGGYCQLRRKVFSNIFVRLVVQRNFIEIFLCKPNIANKIVCFCVSIKGFLQIAFANVHFDLDGSFDYHVSYIRHIASNCQYKKKGDRQFILPDELVGFLA